MSGERRATMVSVLTARVQQVSRLFLLDAMPLVCVRLRVRVCSCPYLTTQTPHPLRLLATVRIFPSAHASDVALA